MSQYKDTLNLPKTAFPMKANLANREPEMLQSWREMGLYQKIRQQQKGCDKFILNDGPPYANGDIHLGHAVNKSLKDFIVKSKTLSGYDAPYIPGWDCHGLPIELNVEKKLGKAGMKISHKDFRKACREYAMKQVNNQSDAFQRLGVLGDWENPYLTMDFKFEADIIRTLGRIIDNGHLHRGYKPVHWCTECGSALAEAEVEYKEKQSPAIDVGFEVIDDEAFWAQFHHSPDAHPKGTIHVVIWTTTPWTLPANQAVAFNAKLDYVVVECDLGGSKRYLCFAEALLKEAMSRWDIDDYRVIAYTTGEKLEGLKLQHPFLPRSVPVVLGDHVTTDAGTGCVHTAPAHGLEDYQVAAHYDLPIDHEVESNGCFSEGTEYLAGLHVSKANDKVIEVLKAKGTLIHEMSLHHSYPHCWRHKTPLIFRGTPQWFISMEQNGLRDAALKAVDDVAWIPDWGKARMADMLEKRPDWCISRQRTWGVPITIFIHRKTGEIHPDTVALFGKVAELVEASGIEAWAELEPSDILGDEAGDYEKVIDTLDVWFDSGSVNACVLEARPELDVPADICLEGSDQHRGWFQTSLLTSMAIRGSAPYRQVLTHGFTVDAQGRKMSKSLGNTILPDKIMKTLGADIIRLWVAATDYRGEMSGSEEILKRTVDTYRRIRNTARYLLANLDGFDPAKDLLPNDQLLALDQWAIDQAYQLQQTVIQAYDDYHFHTVVQQIHNFCAIEMGSFYLDVTKDRQYTTQANSVARRSAQTAMYHIIQALCRWLAPILSFTGDEIWRCIPGNEAESVFLSRWYEDLTPLAEGGEFDSTFWQQVLAVRDEVNKYLEAQRSAGTIGSALNAELSLYCGDELLHLLKRFGDELHFVFITSSCDLHREADKPDDAIATGLEHLWIKGESSQHDKCVRCWHHDAAVGQNEKHPELCPRCVANVDGQGESRHYV